MGSRNPSNLYDYRDLVHPPATSPLEILHWVQRVAAVALYQEAEERGEKEFREAVRKTCDSLRKTLPGLVMASALEVDLAGVDLDRPPPADPLQITLYACGLLVRALSRLLAGEWDDNPTYARLANIRQHARTTVGVISPEVELEAREEMRRVQAKISKRGEPPPLEEVTADMPLRS